MMDGYLVTPTGALLTSVCCLGVVYALVQFRNKYVFWSRRGVKGPKLVPIVADFAYVVEKDAKQAERAKKEKYGRIYGIFAHGSPRLFIGDPEVIKQILIKDFDAFTDHGGMRQANKYQESFLVWLKGDHWRKVRALMTPSFTSGKMKRMFRFMDGCAEDLLEYLTDRYKLQKQKTGASNKDNDEFLIDAREAFSMYSMDGIATCGYGLKLRREQLTEQDQDASSRKNGPVVTSRDNFLKLTQRVFRPSTIRLLIVTLVPAPILRLFDFKITGEGNFEPMIDFIRQLSKKRLGDQGGSNTRKYDDLLQLLLDARLDDKLELDELDQAENHHAALTKDLILNDQQRMVTAANGGVDLGASDKDEKVTTTTPTNPSKLSFQLSELEVLSNAMFLLAAGLETTSTLLTNCVYTLAYHPQVQDRLHEELEKIVEYDATKKKHIFPYESLTSCHYLDSVISETLRLLPPAPFTDRKANRDYLIEKYNIEVPKGCSILLGIRAVQNDPEYWEEPDKFNPDRFMPENRDKIVSGSYLPFSLGPRHCIGMRFSLTEAKLGLAKTVMKFRFTPVPGLPYPPEMTLRPGIQRIKDARVNFVPRS